MEENRRGFTGKTVGVLRETGCARGEERGVLREKVFPKGSWGVIDVLLDLSLKTCTVCTVFLWQNCEVFNDMLHN